ncbi:ABC transporter permease [Vibrio profundum]|uniref:ABC transporter permease n=1 Tax=Vibrio profundum TaxID=2910247 RepID=UPI003D137E41
MLSPVIKALLGHYRRYPFQLLLVWLGLTLGVSLLVGVTSISNNLRQNGESGERVFSDPLPYKIRTEAAGGVLPETLFSTLNREGFHQCIAFKRVPVSFGGQGLVALLGVDPSTSLPNREGSPSESLYSIAPVPNAYSVLVSQSLANGLHLNNGDSITVLGHHAVGPVVIDSWGLLKENQLLTSAKLYHHIADAGVAIIACGAMPPDKLAVLKQALPQGVVLSHNTQNEIESITKAFHMNLTAIGMLAFLVGLFIFYQAMSLSLAQRQPLVGILRQMGVSERQLTQAFLLELVVLILVSWLCGNILGVWLAYQMIPDVSHNLSSMYASSLITMTGWSWRSSGLSLCLTIVGSAVACCWPSIRLLRAQPIRLAKRLSLVRFMSVEFAIQTLFATIFALLAVSLYNAPKTEQTGFAIITFTLLSVALFTPFLIWQLFTQLSRWLSSAKARWFCSDTAASMSYRGVASMAFMLAIAANVGVETTVGSFRHTTDAWLSQRLAADLYVYPDMDSAENINTWLESQPDIAQVWQRHEKETLTPHGPLQVISTGFSDGEKGVIPVKEALPNYWYLLDHGKSVMISESMANRLSLQLGQTVSLYGGLAGGWKIVGIYFDYGNPYNQAILSEKTWQQAFHDSGSVSLGLKLSAASHSAQLKKRIETHFGLGSDRVFDSKTIHRKAMQLFDRTFDVADTLGNITLVIAVFGLFFATLAGENSRQYHLSLLRCFGLSIKEITLMGGAQLLFLGLLSIFIAMPLGLALAKFMVDIVIRQSFGWSMPLYFSLTQYMTTVGVIMASLLLAGAIPILRLVKMSPMRLLKDAI